MADYGRTICPACKREIGCYVPAGGDGTGARIRKHRAHASRVRIGGGVGLCSGSGAIVTEWDDAR